MAAILAILRPRRFNCFHCTAGRVVGPMGTDYGRCTLCAGTGLTRR